MSSTSESFAAKLVKGLIYAQQRRDVYGALGRFYGRRIGWRLSNGLRIVIDNPREFIQAQIVHHGVYEPQIASVLAHLLQPGDVFVDVGANIGNHTLVAAGLGAVVHAFEPVPRLVESLRANVSLNHLEGRVTVFNAAVGDRQGTAVLHVATRGDDGSHSIIPGVEARSIAAERVAVVALDDHFAGRDRGAPAVVKIDVEGFEAKVLDGAAGLLSGPRPPVVIIETADRLAEHIGESASSVLERLLARNYLLYVIPEDGPLVPVMPDRISGDMLNYLACPKSRPCQWIDAQ